MSSEIYQNLNWAQSAGGNSISLYSRVKKNTPRVRPILIIGGVHGDEPEGVWLAEHCLEWLKATEVAMPWLLIPCINVDGYRINERTNAHGVDLNRNFPCPNWSTKHDKPRYYPGPHSGSEPEVQALVKLIESENPQLIIHCHSWNPCVVYTGDPAIGDAQKLGASCGYEVRPDIGYPTPGSLGEYGWKTAKIPVICIEEQDKLPSSDRPKVWQRFAAGFAAVLNDTRARI